MWMTGSKTMRNASGSCKESTTFSPAGKLNGIEHDFVDQLFVAVALRQIHTRTPKDLPEVLGPRQRLRVVSGDATDARADRERHLDHFVQGRLITGRAERAVVFSLIYGLKRDAGIENAAATGTENIPRQFENPEARPM